MTDIFHEVEEEVRREQAAKWWKQYGDYVIAGAAIVVIAVAGYEMWLRYEDGQRMKAAAALVAAQQTAAEGDTAAAIQSYEQIIKTAPSGYVTLAKLSRADALAAGGQRDDAIAAYKSFAEKDSSALGMVARLRAAWLMADTAKRSDLEAWLAPLTDATSAFRFSAREILAFADYKNGDLKKAFEEYRKLAETEGAPDSLRQRSGAMSELIRAGGTGDTGTVPPPEADATKGNAATP